MSPKRRIESGPPQAKATEIPAEASLPTAFDPHVSNRLVRLSMYFTSGRSIYPEGILGVEKLSVVPSADQPETASPNYSEGVSGTSGAANVSLEPGEFLAFGVGSRTLGVLPGVELPDNVRRIPGSDRFAPPPQDPK